MDTLARTTTLRRLHRRFDAYQHLDKASERTSNEGRGWRAFSTRRTIAFGPVKTGSHEATMSSPIWDKLDRARRRHIFLQGYKLSMNTTKGKLRAGIKLKRAMVKVKTMVVSVLSFMRAASLKRCNSKSAIAASSPRNSAHRCF